MRTRCLRHAPCLLSLCELSNQVINYTMMDWAIKHSLAHLKRLLWQQFLYQLYCWSHFFYLLLYLVTVILYLIQGGYPDSSRHI